MTSGETTRQSEGWVLAHPHYELVPIRGMLEAARSLPVGAFTSVTCSPALGLDESVNCALQLSEQGLQVTPHLAARRVRDQAHLSALLERMASAGIRHVFVVAGDRTEHPGTFKSGLDLIREIRERKTAIETIGVPCYPEGHAFISQSDVQEALRKKSEYADYMVSQMCFNAGTIVDWLRDTRRQGISLPLRIGIPGVLERRRLIGIAMRIGLGDSTRFLRKNAGLVGGLLAPSRYTPDDLLDDLNAGLGEPELAIEGLHINTFNQIEAIEQWRGERLESSAGPAAQQAPVAAADASY